MPSKNPGQGSVPVPVVRVVDAPELPPEVRIAVLREINERQFGAIVDVLLEAKYKAEAMLRNDQVFDSALRLAYYQGWVAYADYIISSLERLRSEQIPLEEEPQPGPQ